MIEEAQPDIELVEGVDYYFDGEYMVFTAVYHRKRGYCCGSKCRHCPYGDELLEAPPMQELNGAQSRE